MKKKVLICGATGFIGRNAVEYYIKRDDIELFCTYHETLPFTQEGLTWVHADLTQVQDVINALSGMDIIIQAAAVTSGAKDIVNNPQMHVAPNAIMNALIFRSAVELNIKQVIFFSCSIMYQSSDKPVKEEEMNMNLPLTPSYFGAGWTKFYNEKMCEFYAKLGKTKFTVIRHSNTYGPHDKYDLNKSHVFGATVTKVMTAPNNGKVVVWGTGEEGRDLLYIDDLIAFIDAALTKQQDNFQLMNVGLGKVTTIKDLVAKIIAASGKSITVEYDLSKPTIKTSLCLDITKAGKLFGWQPQVSLEEGIAKTLAWYKTYKV